MKNGRGCVDAVFSKGLSLSYPPYSIVLIEEHHATPYGIIVEGLDSIRYRCKAGCQATWTHNGLLIGDMKLSFHDVWVRDDLRSETRYVLSREERIKARKQLEEFLLVYSRKTPLASALLRSAAPPENWEASFAGDRFRVLLKSLFDASSRGDSRAAAESASGFCGLGMGLTPAGDDFLTGLIALLNSLAANGKERLFVSDFLTELERLLTPGMTNSWGWSFIKPAFDRWQPEPLTEALRDILRRGDFHAARTLAGIGSSSGTDQLCGIAAGLQMTEVLPI